MKIVKSGHRHLIDGTFYMVQRADLKPNTYHWRGYVTDTRGNPRVAWPGGSIWGTEAEALRVAEALATKYPDYPFVVMKATIAVAGVPCARTVRRKLK